MTTRIRLARGGRKKHPFYRIVVADKRSPRDGRFIERVGSYDPLLKENNCTLDVERVNHWLNVGAQPTERVSKLLALQGVKHKMLNLPDEKRVKAKLEEKEAKAKAEAEAKKQAEAEAKQKAEEESKAAAAAAAPTEEAPAEAAPAEEAPAEAAAEAAPAEEVPAEAEEKPAAE